MQPDLDGTYGFSCATLNIDTTDGGGHAAIEGALSVVIDGVSVGIRNTTFSFDVDEAGRIELVAQYI